MTVSPKIRKQVFDRDMWCCVACGTSYELTIQHRINRQAGGSKHRDNLANLIVLCWFHNSKLESDPEFARIGRKNGWKLKSYEDPKLIPVKYPDGKYLIDDEIRRTPIGCEERIIQNRL